uniref:Seipin n=1 Tax=Angiostrongylus cantonensis TaxID=6313 RepID=A0A0K0CVN1_ANGCA
MNSSFSLSFQERDEINKYAYFEVLFLGREGESYVHEHRLRLLYRLALYALQHPVFQLYSQISLWLSKVSMCFYIIVIYSINEKMNKDFTLLGNNFEKCTTALQYEYLLPLETACPEFTVFFVVYATRFMPINRPMAAVFASYINANPGYFLKGFRDSPHLADIFRSEYPVRGYRLLYQNRFRYAFVSYASLVACLVLLFVCHLGVLLCGYIKVCPFRQYIRIRKY